MISIHSSSPSEVTVLSNRFIDEFMPQANGEFVKVYIYLLRVLSNEPPSFGLEQMADHLLCTERDICRALKYWEKEQLMTLEFSSDKKLSGIIMHMPDSAPAAAAEAPSPAARKSPAVPSPSPVPPAAEISAAQERPERTAPGSLTPDRVKELKQDEDIVQLLYITEQYLGKTLTPTEMQTILYIYDELKMPIELMEYLIEYCVSHNHKSVRYMETVALAWTEAGIRTVQMAKDANSRYTREYYAILKAMGITGRNPVENEIQYMNTWLKEYGFDLTIISEACSRTVLQTGQSSFQYTEKILAGWKKKKVRNLDDIKVLDQEHLKRKSARESSRSNPPRQQPASNRFNNFSQRDYNFDEYEKRLLNQ